MPFWSIGIAATCIQFVYYVLLTSLPTYFATILRFNLQKVRFHLKSIQNDILFCV